MGNNTFLSFPSRSEIFLLEKLFSREWNNDAAATSEMEYRMKQFELKIQADKNQRIITIHPSIFYGLWIIRKKQSWKNDLLFVA